LATEEWEQIFMLNDAKQEEKIIRNYLLQKSVLIVDSSSTSRSAIRKLMSGLGVKASQISHADNYSDAKEQLHSLKANIVFTDYFLDGKNCGLDLIPFQKEAVPQGIDRVLFVLSASSSDAVRSHVAEHDADALVMKPFTFIELRDIFMESIAVKAYPTDYFRVLQKGKDFLFERNFDQAIKVFQKSRPMDSFPANAIYWEAVCWREKGDFDKSESVLREALSSNPNHYNAYVALFEILYTKKAYKEAYEIGVKLRKSFPLNPVRVPALIRLSVLNQSHDDVLSIAEDLMADDRISSEVRSHTAAGLVVAGKHFLRIGEAETALQTFKKADFMGRSGISILKEIALTLLAAGKDEEASHYIAKLPDEEKNSPEIRLAQLRALESAGGTPEEILRLGRALQDREIIDPDLYELVIKASVELKRRYSLIEAIVSEAVEHFPEQKSRYQRWLNIS
jgi:tetratricopeptide (TPR) repeat protein